MELFFIGLIAGGFICIGLFTFLGRLSRSVPRVTAEFTPPMRPPMTQNNLAAEPIATDLIQKQFNAIGNPVIPTRESMGLPPLHREPVKHHATSRADGFGYRDCPCGNRVKDGASCEPVKQASEGEQAGVAKHLEKLDYRDHRAQQLGYKSNRDMLWHLLHKPMPPFYAGAVFTQQY